MIPNTVASAISNEGEEENIHCESVDWLLTQSQESENGEMLK